MGVEEMDGLLNFVWTRQGLFWLCGAIVAGAGWRRFRKVSWGIFTFVLLLKFISWELNNGAAFFESGKSMVFTHGLFAEEAWRDPEHNRWKVEAPAIADGVLPLLFIPGLIARWIEEKP